MRNIDRRIERLERQYSAGTRIELLHMDDVQVPPIGTHGTVNGINSFGDIEVNWDNGSMLSVIFDAGDQIRKVGD